MPIEDIEKRFVTNFIRKERRERSLWALRNSKKRNIFLDKFNHNWTNMIFETHGASLPLLPWNRVPFFSWLPRPFHEKFAHARIYTKTRIRKLLEKHGFEIVESSYITAPMDVLPDGKLKEMVINNVFNSDTTSVPMKSTSIFVVAKKRK